ncbi:hypothetical protein NS365_13385 [Aureimonas ureilytica]|uniref:Uncharacterized protein n=1 Tax=Aureimonas ureilytica TaxID=401562 RepID=A0A175RMH4_9HYPH|nr:hypothetical protein [Aureimonas ureilytica]KTR05015.1 hypothetical protein NS365_13385 [Aureimonas ureilytica]
MSEAGVQIRVGGGAGYGSNQTVVRCRTGSFEWRYARQGSPQYHAGSAFARDWERSGITLPSALMGGASIGGGGGWKGLPDERVMALDRVLTTTKALGGPITRRLVAYCVEGLTPKEIARTYGDVITPNAMANILDCDLLELVRVVQ